jgi:transporter family-2 protein
MQEFMIIFMLLGLMAGASIPIHAGINSRLATFTGSPVSAVAIAFFVGAITCIIFSLITRTPFPKPGAFTGAPWWIWIGGSCVVFTIMSITTLAPKLGAVLMITLMIAGQMIASTIIDHYGFLGYPVHPINIYKIAGIIIVAVGVGFIKFS